MQKWISQAAAGSDTRRILVIVSMMGIFATTQALYGLRAGSLGLVSDSFHMFFHCAALLVSLIGMIASAERGASVSFSYSYGFDRHEVLASFSNALFLIFVGFFIIAGAVGRLFQPSLIEQSALIFEFGIAGLVLNVVGLVVLGPGQSAADHVRRFTKGGPVGGSSAKAAGALPTHQSRGPVSSARASNVDAVRLNFLSHTVSSLAVVASSLAVRYAGWLVVRARRGARAVLGAPVHSWRSSPRPFPAGGHDPVRGSGHLHTRTGDAAGQNDWPHAAAGEGRCPATYHRLPMGTPEPSVCPSPPSRSLACRPCQRASARHWSGAAARP